MSKKNKIVFNIDYLSKSIGVGKKFSNKHKLSKGKNESLNHKAKNKKSKVQNQKAKEKKINNKLKKEAYTNNSKEIDIDKQNRNIIRQADDKINNTTNIKKEKYIALKKADVKFYKKRVRKNVLKAIKREKIKANKERKARAKASKDNAQSKIRTKKLTKAQTLQVRNILADRKVFKDLTNDKKLGKLKRKQKKLEKKVEKQGKILDKIDTSQKIVSEKVNRNIGDFVSYMNKDDNTGLKAIEKSFSATASVNRYALKLKRVKQQSLKRKAFKTKKKITNRVYKVEKKSRLKNLKKTKDYKNSSALKKFFKRRNMKAQLKNKYGKGIKNRLKKSGIQAVKYLFELFKKSIKNLILGLIIILLGIIVVGSCADMTKNTVSAMLNGTMSSTYLSSEDTLNNINNNYINLEQALNDELDEASIKEEFPDYDEYIISKADIGHDVHVLLSYVTAKYGDIKDVNAINDDLKALFNKVYDIKYEEIIEIRYRNVTSTGTDANGNEITETISEPYEYKKLKVTLTKANLDEIVREEFAEYKANLEHYENLLSANGNMADIFGSGGASGDLSEVVQNKNFQNPGIEYTDTQVAQLFNEAEKHIGKQYVWGATGPNTFDCSGFICYSYTHSGFSNMPRTTAYGIFKNYCVPISPEEAQAGDLVFFGGTYKTKNPITHIGIYAGNGMMLHAGHPIQYTSINTPYWRQHFYSFGRVK